MDDSALKRALSYRRFGDVPRILLFDADYLVVRDVREAIEDLGWALCCLRTPTKGTGASAFVRNLLAELVSFKPDYVLTVNHIGFDERGALATLLGELGILTATWFVDHPLPILGGASANATSSTQVFSFERAALPWLREQGFEDPVYLPTASNGRYFRVQDGDSEQVARLRHPVSFVGNSWFTKARLEPAAWARKASRRLSRDPRSVKSILDDHFKRRLRGLSLPPRGAYVVARVVLAEASMRRRQGLAKALAADGLRVYGDPHWRELAPEVELAGTVDYHRELPAVFAASDVNVNVTAVQMPTAVNQRVFDVPASGGFLLTDAQEDALRLFDEDKEIVVYRQAAEASEKIRYYVRHPEARRAIAARARLVVEARHRYTHRLKALHETMRRRDL